MVLANAAIFPQICIDHFFMFVFDCWEYTHIALNKQTNKQTSPANNNLLTTQAGEVLCYQSWGLFLYYFLYVCDMFHSIIHSLIHSSTHLFIQ